MVVIGKFLWPRFKKLAPSWVVTVSSSPDSRSLLISLTDSWQSSSSPCCLTSWFWHHAEVPQFSGGWWSGILLWVCMTIFGVVLVASLVRRGILTHDAVVDLGNLIICFLISCLQGKLRVCRCALPCKLFEQPLTPCTSLLTAAGMIQEGIRSGNHIWFHAGNTGLQFANLNKQPTMKIEV